MTAKVIDGKEIARGCLEGIAERVQKYIRQNSQVPGLGVILVGDDPASAVYVKNKERACKKVGIASYHRDLPADATADRIAGVIDILNQDPRVHGILLQLPLPKGIDEAAMLARIHPDKDADGFHPINAGYLAVGQPRYVPCTPKGVMTLIRSTGVKIEGAHAVVVGRSNIVGKPQAQLLLAENATVTICHSRTRDLARHVASADILVAAVGRPRMIRGEWVKPGAVVIDVGINRLEGGELVGDVEYDAAAERAGFITPVPGGVGPMTIAMLLENTLEGAIRSRKK